jgi:hypothetical protein
MNKDKMWKEGNTEMINNLAIFVDEKVFCNGFGTSLGSITALPYSVYESVEWI